jgi:hypothetical protein
LVFFCIATILIELIEKLSNVIFNTRYIINYYIFNYSYVIPIYLFFSFLMLSSGIYITIAIRIDDKDIEAISIKQVMDKMKWKLKDENENTIIFSSPVNIGLLMDEMVIEFIDNEIHITGPRESVKRAISRSNFLYTPYEIKKLKQEDEMNGRFTSNFYKKKY